MSIFKRVRKDEIWIDMPLHCKSDTKCHVFCKWFVEWSNGMFPRVRTLAHGIESLMRDNKLHFCILETVSTLQYTWLQRKTHKSFYNNIYLRTVTKPMCLFYFLIIFLRKDTEQMISSIFLIFHKFIAFKTIGECTVKCV